ncbi:MAG: cell wall-binding repeat-containing protein [Coriobacteriia bacterium]
MSTRYRAARTARPFLAIAFVAAFVLAVPSVAPALSRSTILARAARWVQLGVPYSQSSYFEGYRTDCSGYVSMAWALTYNGQPTSLSTAGLDAPNVSVAITKNDLQPGDMILRPNDQPGAPYGHAVIFAGWADVARTTYYGYHESSSKNGAVYVTIPYPFYNETGFAPRRFVGVGDDYLDVIQPVYGANRYDTSVQSSWLAFPNEGDAKAVVLASGENWPDALSGASLAGASGGPVLLTKGDGLPTSVRNEIDRLNVTQVYLLGGTASVSESVETAARAIPGVNVTRIAGRDRWETSALVALETKKVLAAAGSSSQGAYIVTGRAFPDALAVSPVAYRTARPILLTDPSYLPTITAAAITSLGVTDAWLIGGDAAIGVSAAADIQAAGVTCVRLAGGSRYTTALAVVNHGVTQGLSWTGCGIATGATYADALSGGAAQGTLGSVLVLTPPQFLDNDVARELTAERDGIGRVRMFGGASAIGEVTRAQVASIIRGQ